jgi:hypothetical protein
VRKGGLRGFRQKKLQSLDTVNSLYKKRRAQRDSAEKHSKNRLNELTARMKIEI